MKICNTCMYEPILTDVEGTCKPYYKTGECIKNGEPLIKIKDEFYVEGGCGDNGVCLLKDCKDYVMAREIVGVDE